MLSFGGSGGGTKTGGFRKQLVVMDEVDGMGGSDRGGIQELILLIKKSRVPIQKFTEDHGYGVVRELVGHGLGRKMHEDPEIPNYGRRGRGKKFVEGMVIAIEPMTNMGTHRIKQLRDGWTILTADGKPSAHFEHDVALIDGKPEILSTFKYINEALGIVTDEEDAFRQEFLTV